MAHKTPCFVKIKKRLFIVAKILLSQLEPVPITKEQFYRCFEDLTFGYQLLRHLVKSQERERESSEKGDGKVKLLKRQKEIT